MNYLADVEKTILCLRLFFKLYIYIYIYLFIYYFWESYKKQVCELKCEMVNVPVKSRCELSVKR